MNDRAIKKIADFLEYAFLLVVILECNSMYMFVAETVGSTGMTALCYKLALSILAVLLVLHGWINRRQLRKLAGYSAVLAALLAAVAAFYFLNVNAMERWQKRQYLMNFAAFLPMAAALFRFKRLEKKPFDLLHKHSDIMCALGAMSLVIYLASVIRPDSVPSDAIYSRWTDTGRITTQINLLEVCQSFYGSKWPMAGISLLRNKSLFTEPLMFALPLLLALYTELFLRDRSCPKRIFRRILLSAALVTANATIGLMLMALAWGLKGIQTCMRAGGKRRLLILPVLVAAVCACVVLYTEKDRASYDVTEISGNSISAHLEDYRISLKAFSEKPLLGGGYQNEEYIHGFMSEARLKRNRGLSNSAAVILAEGGIALGALCMAPFLICFLFFFKKRDSRIAYWAVGPLGAYLGIIFKYTLVLMLLLSFGYSLVDLRRSRSGTLGLRLPAASGESEKRQRPSRAVGGRGRTVFGACAAVVCAALIAFGAPVWQAAHTFLRSHQFSLTQSPLRSFCFAIVLVLHGAWIRQLLRGGFSWKRLAALLAWDAVFLLAYPLLYSWVSTLLALHGLWSEMRECFLLLVLYFAAIPMIAFLAPGKRRIRRAAALAGAAALALGAAYVFTTRQLDHFAAQADSLAPALQSLVDSASGSVYVDDLPLLYHRRVRGVSLSTTHRTGYDVRKNATVVVPRGTERRELFDSGYELAELMDGYLVYSCDEGVLNALSGQGRTFHRYYPYEEDADLIRVASCARLGVTESGLLLVDGPLESLEAGPDDTLAKGQYTVSYALHIDPARYAGREAGSLIGSALVCCDYGEKKLARKDVTLDLFDDAGDAVIELPFKLSKISDGVQYRLTGEEGCRIGVRRIAVRQTPDYVTVTAYNGHRDPVREAYYYPDDTPYVRAGGFAALEREYDMADRIKVIRYYDGNLEPVLKNGDYFEIRYTRNGQGSISREDYFGFDGKPMRRRDGYASMEMEYDEYGNASVLRYYDESGAPVLSTSGYAEIRRVYNDREEIIREAYFDTDGTPKEQPGGYVSIEQEFDEEGRVSLRRFCDAQGDPVLRTNGSAEVRWQRNELGQIIREEYYDTQGIPVAITSGYAAVEREFDDAGNVVVQRYYNTNNEPVELKAGYAERRRVYNAKRQIVREEYYGVDGLPKVQSTGYVAFEQEFDERGNVSVRRFFGADGGPVVRTDGYAEVHWAYDLKRQIIREEFYGPDGRPVCVASGQAANEREYDSAGNTAVLRYYDAQGEPVAITSGYAEIRRTYDSRRQIVSEAYYGVDGQPCVQGAGHAGFEQEFDGAGNVTVKRYIGGDGVPVIISDGYAEIHRAYDGRHRVVREEYFDADGLPCVQAAGHAGVEQEYNDDGKLAVRRYLDANGNAAMRVDGYSEARWTYDESRVRRVAFYDLNGSAVSAEGLNLVLDMPSGQSAWHAPQRDMKDRYYKIATVNLDEGTEGDTYTIQLEIEFSNVAVTEGKSFLFLSQGAVDGSWSSWRERNIWNSRVVRLEDAPEDGVYTFTLSQTITEQQAGAETFDLGFRCDNWAAGAFRVRRLKVEKGDSATAWTPGI